MSRMSVPVIDGCNPSDWSTSGAFDRLREGGVVAVNATVAFWERYEVTSDRVAGWWRRFRTESDLIIPVLTIDDIREAERSGRVGIIQGWQNLSPIEDDLQRLELFHRAGLRIAQLTYNIRNLVGSGCLERADDGLSLFGYEVVKAMNEIGILIDLSHVGDVTSREAIELSSQPVAFTHANLREFMDVPRNKPRDLVRMVAERGGVIGANAFPQFLPRGYESSIDDYLDAIEALIEVVGVDHVAIATDFCEGWSMDDWRRVRALHGTFARGTPAVPRPDPGIRGMESATQMQAIVSGLADRGYRQEEVAKIASGNWMRLYQAVWQ